jgi:hypothetical protein
MARELEQATATALTAICGRSLATPDWLIRPGKSECGDRWALVQDIYHRLSGLDLPEVMRPIESRTVDGVFVYADDRTFIFELDEVQHFNTYRATTLRCYPDDLPLAFDKDEWIKRCAKKSRLEGGGFAVPRPPLFPDENGRHMQRAFRDALCDILPSEHGFLPTLRLGDFDVGSWIERDGASERMGSLLDQRLGTQVT